MEKQPIDIFDLLTVIAKHRNLILIILAIVSVGSVAYALLAPQQWSSHAVLRPVDQDESLMSLGSSFMGLGGALLGGGISFRGEDFITIMSSRTFSEDIIRQYNMIEYFKINEADSLVAMEMALRKLHRKVMELYFDEEEGTVHIVAITKDKELSRDMANTYWEKLDRYNREYKVTKGRENRQFLEKRLEEVRAEIERLAVELKEFLEDNNTVALDEQTRETIGIYAELIAQKFEADLELDYARKFASEDAMEVVRLRQMQQALARQISEMESEGVAGADGAEPRFIVALERFPDLQYQYGKLMLEFEVQQSIYEFLYPQYEQARIDELRDTPTIELIDKAKLAGRRAKPKRARLCVTNFVVAFVLSIFLAFIVEYVQQNREKATHFWRLLWRKHS